MSADSRERKDHLPQPASKALAFVATRVHCWLTVKFAVHQDPEVFLSKAAFQPVSYQGVLVPWVIPQGARLCIPPC